jgi:hypothetical protein
MRSPLVLTGGPAVAKSTTARLLALATDPASVVDVDDDRGLGRLAVREGALEHKGCPAGSSSSG